MSRQSYSDVMKMPIKKLKDYIAWKTNLEEEKKKMMEEQGSK